MASDAQIIANRNNAARSTGPRTPEGKARSARNFRSHGACSTWLLPDESRPAFHALRAAYLAQYQPANETESFLVARLTLAAWRLNRLGSLEGRVLARHHESALVDRDWARAITDVLHSVLLPDPPDEEPGPPRPPAGPIVDPVARAYMRDSERGNTITKLARYQTALERSYYRALHALEHVRKPLGPRVAPDAGGTVITARLQIGPEIGFGS